MTAGHAGDARRKVLFFAESVTLAHVARPVVLAQALAEQGYDVHLAHSPRYRTLLGQLPLTEHDIQSISPQQFLASLAGGKPLYDLETLEAYVREDLNLIETIRPDIVVGDFRLSLAVSAELAKVPHVALSNAYWSTYCHQSYTVPELPFVRALGPALGQALFSLARPLAFAQHCLPMHRLRRRHGLPSLGFSLQDVYTHADRTLYADIPEMFNMAPMPESHAFIGPLVWSPQVPLPEWWDTLPAEKPSVYVTLGSSGQAACLPALIAALGQLDVIALVSTAGGPVPADAPGNVRFAPYLPGEKAVARADLVICNGGSPTAHQALIQGVPVLGLAGNLDQYLNMQAVERVGAGRLLRSGTANTQQMQQAITELLADSACRASAAKLGKALGRLSPVVEFSRIINEL